MVPGNGNIVDRRQTAEFTRLFSFAQASEVVTAKHFSFIVGRSGSRT